MHTPFRLFQLSCTLILLTGCISNPTHGISDSIQIGSSMWSVHRWMVLGGAKITEMKIASVPVSDPTFSPIVEITGTLPVPDAADVKMIEEYWMAERYRLPYFNHYIARFMYDDELKLIYAQEWVSPL